MRALRRLPAAALAGQFRVRLAQPGVADVTAQAAAHPVPGARQAAQDQPVDGEQRAGFDFDQLG